MLSLQMLFSWEASHRLSLAVRKTAILEDQLRQAPPAASILPSKHVLACLPRSRVARKQRLVTTPGPSTSSHACIAPHWFCFPALPIPISARPEERRWHFCNDRI